MNRGPLDLQSNALPLCYTPGCLLRACSIHDWFAWRKGRGRGSGFRQSRVRQSALELVRLAEWSKASDLSSDPRTGVVGSNPTPDTFLLIGRFLETLPSLRRPRSLGEGAGARDRGRVGLARQSRLRGGPAYPSLRRVRAWWRLERSFHLHS